jgi:hypothetical protein
VLNGRRVLILLDNARDVEQVRPLLPGSPGCLVIVTSRPTLTGLMTSHGVRALTVDPFSVDEAREALARRLGPARLGGDGPALAKVVELCAGLPLALAIVAARATVHRDLGLSVIASELCDARTRLDALSTDDAATDVRRVFSWSYRSLSAPARRLFRLAAVYAGPDFSRAGAGCLAGLPAPAVLPLLKELSSARLIIEHQPGRFTFHDLVRVYAAELSAALDSDDGRGAATLHLGGRAYTHHSLARARHFLGRNDEALAELERTRELLTEASLRRGSWSGHPHEFRRSFSDGVDRGIGIGRDDRRHDRCVGDAESGQAVNAEIGGINDRHVVDTHPAGAGVVEIGPQALLQVGVDGFGVVRRGPG